MILKEITLYNFRQFYDEYTLKFNTSINPGKNVTLVIGQNGSGKTALLNSILWCLYGEGKGKTTESFKGSEKIISLKAIAESQVDQQVSCKVSIIFEHNDGSEYTITRQRIGRRVSDNLNLKEKDEKLTFKKGNEEEDQNPSKQRQAIYQEQIEKLLPIALAPYFFFDGESLQYMTSKNEKMATAIRLIMGIIVLTRSANDLKEISKKFMHRWRNNSKNKKFEIQTEKLDNMIEELRKDEKQLEFENEEIKAIEERISSIEKKLEEDEFTRQSQKELKEVEEKIKDIKNKQTENQKNKAEALSSIGCLIFLEDMIKNVEKLIKKSKKAGLIPKPYQKAFIEDLLNRKKCICGSDITQGTEVFNKIHQLRDQGSDDDVDQKVAELNGKIEDYKDKTESFKNDLDHYLSQEGQLESSLLEFQERETVISKKLGKQARQIEESENLAEIAERLKKEKDEKNKEVGRLENEIKNNKNDQDKLKNELKKLTEKDQKGNLAKKRMEVAEKIGSFLEGFAEWQEQQIHKELQEGINKTFKEIAIKPFKIELSSSYKFKVLNEFGQNHIEIGESAGESQMLSLAFIGNLLQLAKKPKNALAKMFSKGIGGNYPLVIDSPFGPLDNNYRPQIIEAEINLAPQVIIFASGSQWDDAIDKKVRPYINSQYFIKYFKPEHQWKDEDNKDYILKINNKEYKFLEKTSEYFEFSRLEKIRNE